MPWVVPLLAAGKDSSVLSSPSLREPQQRRRRASWEERYDALLDYKEIEGHCNVPQSEKPLGTWVNRQRIEHARYLESLDGSERYTSMTAERKAKLDAIGFIWDATSHTWNVRYDELRRFREDNGHAVVPRSRGALGAWVEKQRIEYKKFVVSAAEAEAQSRGGNDNGKKDESRRINNKLSSSATTILTQERVRKLEDVGFVWDVRERIFEQKLGELRRFLERYGHINSRHMEGKLRGWVRRQERQYRKCVEMSAVSKGAAVAILSPSRRAALEAVGFNQTALDGPPPVKARRAQWEERYDELVAFKEEAGHCVVPKNHGPLGSWVRYQRHLRKEQWDSESVGGLGTGRDGIGGPPETEGSGALLSKERVDRLDQLGFVWDVHQWQWNQTFHELLDYRAANGNTNVPMSHGGLGLWVFNQRAHHNSHKRGTPSHMTQERYELLDSIGFEFELGRKMRSEADARWFVRLEELRKHGEERGTMRVERSEFPSLFNWCQNQKASYRATKLKKTGGPSPMSKKRENALREIGFFDDVI